MRPLDPRLLKHASAARWFLVVGAVLGLAQTLVVVAFSWLLSQSITLAVEGQPLARIRDTVTALAAVVILRAVIVWLLEVAANRGAAAVKSQLRSAVLAKIADRGPDWLAGQQNARVATVITTGLDALDNYFARYLPQLLLTVIATPILVLVMLWQDLPSGITVIIVLPLVPIFMILIGYATQSVQRAQWESLQRLSAGFLDVVGGLATLKIFGREQRQTGRLGALTGEYRGRTMSVLRVSFLSGFVLELAGSLSVALIAVSIGLRLVEGSLLLGVGLFVLLLAPEAFLPVRQVGAQFHAAADGLAAAEEVFTILDDDVDRRGKTAPPVGPGEPGTPSSDELTEQNRGGLTVPASVVAGSTFTAMLPASGRSRTLTGWLFSEPTALGTVTASAGGAIPVTLPASVPAGEHRLALTDATGAIIGWDEVTVTAAGGSTAPTQDGALASTGVNAPGAVGLAVLVLLGGALLFAARRPRTR